MTDLLAITNVYAIQDDDCIQLPPGEVFCRMLMGDGSLCFNVRIVRVMDYRGFINTLLGICIFYARKP